MPVLEAKRTRIRPLVSGDLDSAARAVVDYAFGALRLGRIVATTEHDNEASMSVMRKLGMRVERNPHPEPPWFQVVGILDYQGPPA